MKSSGKRIVWFGSWLDSNDKINQIHQNSKLFKNNGWDVGFVTHYPQLEGLDFTSFDYVIFDRNNEMYFSETQVFKNGFERIYPSCSEMKQDIGDLSFIDRKARATHQFPLIKNYSSSMLLSKEFGYGVYAYMEGDFFGSQNLCDLMEMEARKIESGFEFVGFDSYTFKGSVNACIFLGDPKFLSLSFPPDSVKSEQEFYRFYPNEASEDILKRISTNSENSIIYPKNKVEEFLGEHGKDWDTSHAGFVWLESDVSERTLASFTTNAPFLEKSDFGFVVHYLFKQELINHPVKFSVSLVIRDEDQDREIFNASEDVIFNNFYYWKNVYELKINSGQILLVDTATECNGQIYNNRYEISTDFHEITGYYRLRHVLYKSI